MVANYTGIGIEGKRVHNLDNSDTIGTMTHPDYDAMLTYWEKYRLTYKGGKLFNEEYLKKFSDLEDETDFKARKEISYCAAHAKAALNDLKNSIYQRMSEVTRAGGTQTYEAAVKGLGHGVDRNGNSMTGFIGRIILPEMLSIGKVGIYIDRPTITGSTLADARNKTPYLYAYRAEDILSWTYDSENKLSAVLLRDYIDDLNEYGLVTDQKTQYRLLQLTSSGVIVQLFNADGGKIDERTLNLKTIPFVIAEISQSLLTDIADYQIALTNLESSDINYSLKSNFPFYTEQGDLHEMVNEMLGTSDDGTEEEAIARPRNVKTGATKGRKYAVGTERPAFIHPSADPLKVSIEKGNQLKEDIRSLMNLTVANLHPVRRSADAREKDDAGLESGLSCIGLELEYVERQIAEIWASYEGSMKVATIKYPEKYRIKTDEEKQKEADELQDKSKYVPSITYRKAAAKEIVNLTLATKLSEETLNLIYQEIDKQPILVGDPDTIIGDHEAGLVSTKSASMARGYPEGESEQASIDHAEKLARISAAQSSPNPGEDKIDQARGLGAVAANPKSGEEEKNDN